MYAEFQQTQARISRSRFSTASRRAEVRGVIGARSVLLLALLGGCGSDPGVGTDTVGSLTVSVPDGGGRVRSEPAGLDCAVQCSAEFALGATVSLSAQPDAGYEFAGWQGACQGQDPRCTLTLTAAASVQARFVAVPTTSVLVTRSGQGSGQILGGSIACGTSCGGRLRTGTTLVLEARPDAGSFFKGWSGACTGSAFTCELTLGSDIAVNAQFERPRSCDEIRTGVPKAAAGTYQLFVGGDPGKAWTAYCVLSTPAATYLELPQQTNANYSQYTAGGARPGTSARSQFQRVRIDPELLRINGSDFSFSQSVGSVDDGSGGKITRSAYGSAGDCIGSVSQAGVANVNLVGTPFAVEPNVFVVNGYTAAGGATYSSNDQIVALRGGGFCGGIGPRALPTDPYNLSLRYIGP